jgi:hypothetical protein
MQQPFGQVPANMSNMPPMFPPCLPLGGWYGPWMLFQPQFHPGWFNPTAAPSFIPNNLQQEEAWKPVDVKSWLPEPPGMSNKAQEGHAKEAGSSGLTVEEKMRDLTISDDTRKSRVPPAAITATSTTTTGTSTASKKPQFEKAQIPAHWFAAKQKGVTLSRRAPLHCRNGAPRAHLIAKEAFVAPTHAEDEGGEGREGTGEELQ